MRKFITGFLLLIMCGCAAYQTPPRNEWPVVLKGASFSEMTADAKIAKRPILLGAGGKLISNQPATSNQYGAEPTPADVNPAVFKYMSALEKELYDSLLKPGIQVQRVGTDVVLLIVRDAFMYTDAPEISADGIDTLKIIAKILKKYDATFIEVAGYTDAMRDKNAAHALSLDMAQRVAIYFAKHEITPVRMFIAGRGSARPIAAQDDKGRLMSRRVEIRLSPAR